MFRCARCEKLVEATAADPVVATSQGYLHFACFRLASSESLRASEDRREASRARRSDAMRAAWEKRKAEGATP